ncbi:MAG: hypothetical protein L0287_37670 [Anaerolineae bacterium]|nr:hypothetical protein [Anaerolineae bacterium]
MNTIQFFANKNCSEIVDPIDVAHRPAGTNLFELQMGLVDIGNGQAVWAGSLQKVHNGEKRYFKGWSGLVANLQEMLTPLAQFRVLQELMAAEIALEYMQNTR